jgi:hypothetical protein
MIFRKTILLLLLLLTISSISGLGQTYGNEWINYTQKYYAFNVYTTGVHKLDYTALSAAGIPLSTFTSDNIQIFGREKEIPLYIEDGADSDLDPGDYILFYAEKNDGWLDSSLYDTPNDIGNPKYSLYNDTIQYFFTWNNSTSNLRYTVETDINYSAYTPSNYILFERFQSNSDSYNEGLKSSEASSSFYTSGEGWGSTPVNGAAGYTWDASSVSIDQIYQGADAPNVEYSAVSVGVSNASYSGTGNHHVRHTIGSSNYVISDTIFTGYKAVHIKKNFPVSVLPASGGSNFKISIIADQGAVTDYQSINYWSFLYPRIPNLSGSNKTSFLVENNPLQTKVRVDLTNLSTVDPFVFVLGDVPRKVSLQANGGAYSILLPNSGNNTDQQIVYQESSTFFNVSQLTPVNNNGFFTDYSALSSEEALLMIYHPALQLGSSAYASYRISPTGGGYNVILANVKELYQQYGGGIPVHINGIRRFAQHMYDLATNKPVGLFLMGKGIREANIGGITATGPGTRKSPAVYMNSFIPSFGQPSSDALITSNLPGTTRFRPLIPTGRISISTNAELLNYLEKVQIHEQNQDSTDIYNSASKDWQKHVMHLVGGSDVNQMFTFQNYMDYMEGIIENQFFGGEVMAIEKTDNNPLAPSELNAITDRISEGISLMTFFGHALPGNSGFEINLDEPSNWNNYGKYPIVITNSCYNGNIFQNSVSTSERFVNAEDAGAIAYIGTVNLGFAHTLFQYSSELYRQMSGSNYGKPLSKQIQATIDATLIPGIDDLLLESTVTQMALNGDPMIRLNHHVKPEIEITEQSVSFSPNQLDLTVDSIDVTIQLKNLGHSIIDTFSVEVTRDFPGTSVDSVYLFTVPYLHYTYDLNFKLPLQANIGVGINNFSVKVDLPTFVDEVYDEVNNNQILKTLFINVDGIQPVIPYDYAVVPIDSVTVKGSTINPIAEFNTYRFEIDTIDFEGAPSPFHRYALVSGLGGVKEVNPSQWILSSSGMPAPLVCTDSTVYFWRASVNDANPVWRESSFQYIPNKEGWGQDHFYQFKKNSFNGIIYDRVQRLREFGPNNKQIKCDNKTYASGSIQYYIDNQLQEYALCSYEQSIHVAIIDPLTLNAWGTKYTYPDGTIVNPNHSFGNANDNGACRPRAEKYFIFRQTSTSQLQAFENMILSSVPDGHYILIYTPVTTLFNSWDVLSPSIYNVFQQLGSTQIVQGHPNESFIFFCKKGDLNSVVETYANGQSDYSLEAELVGFDYIGQESSTLIGPAAEWGSMYWKQDPTETSSADSTVLYIRGFDIAGNLQMVIDTTFTLNDSIIDLSTLVNASQYPYLQLGAYYTDTLNFSPAQIDRWHVLYSPLPEAAIDGSTAYTWLPASDTLSEGQDVQFAVDVKNIFTLPMDSLLINYWVQDANQVKHPIAYPRQDSLLVNETFRDTITFSTLGLAGINSLWMEVNPYINGSVYVTDQPEQKHFNNLLQVPFYVEGDDEHPILDVTFNGRHILNGDIVAPESEILITLKDENPYLIMDDISDTTLFGVYLTDPKGVQKRIPFMDASGNTIMQWIPADAQYKRFKIVFPANFELDGKYTLAVQGSDRSGNLSGDMEYRISFEVIHESMITYLMNYPNPFSTSTRFVFTLTGNEAPDEILIQIMTVSGKVVREITEDELGPIQIGRNITEYAWDGTDEFGDPLANGVYLYTVKAQINGEDIKHLESGADSHFKKEFGKMYLMR